MLSRNDPAFQALIEKGISIGRLEKRLRPQLGLGDWRAEVGAHDEFSDYSRRGFLGVHENLLDVIHADWQTVERYNVSHEKVADALYLAIKQKGNLSRRYEFYKEEDFSDGPQSCPWGCPATFGISTGIIFKKGISAADKLIGYMGAFMVLADDLQDPRLGKLTTRLFGEEITRAQLEEAAERKKAGERVYAVTNMLLPHLIKEHYFFQGRESPYRMDPAFVIQALGLV